MRPLSVFTLLRLIGSYKKGTHLEDPRFKKYITYRRVKKVEVKSDTPFALCLDGEILETTHFTAEALPGAVEFAAPQPQTSQMQPV